MVPRPLFALCLLGALAATAAPAGGQTFNVLRTGLCMERIVGPDGAGAGIATGVLADEAFVALCNGKWAHIGPDGRPPLSEPPRLPAVPDDPERLPDAQVTRSAGPIAAAWLIEPTERYGHGVLGDATEAAGLRVLRRSGVMLDLRLDERSVFEDLRVRIADLTGDGATELIVVRSQLDQGAALAVYGLEGNLLRPVAETRPIGQRNRWLNPAGAADFDGDGRVEIAYVETPHIGGILRLFELRAGELRPDGVLRGFSNHAIGSRELGLAAVLDWNGDGRPDLALPDATRKRMTIVGAPGRRLTLLDAVAHEARISTAVLATDFNGDGAAELLYGLENGDLVLARP